MVLSGGGSLFPEPGSVINTFYVLVCLIFTTMSQDVTILCYYFYSYLKRETKVKSDDRVSIWLCGGWNSHVGQSGSKVLQDYEIVLRIII